MHGDTFWWNALPGKLKRFAKLMNLWHERAQDVIQRVASGTSLSRADGESRGVYDTWDWSEVISRLHRGRGKTQTVVATLAADDILLRETAGGSRCVRDLCAKIGAAASRLKALASDAAAAPTDELPDIRPPVGRKNAMRSPTFKKLTGSLKLCLTFLEKNVREVPRMRKKTGSVPTPCEIAVVLVELKAIDTAARALSVRCRGASRAAAS